MDEVEHLQHISGRAAHVWKRDERFPKFRTSLCGLFKPFDELQPAMPGDKKCSKCYRTIPSEGTAK